MWLHSTVGRASHPGIAEVTGSNSVEASRFFRLLPSNCLIWNIYCDDDSSNSLITAVQISISCAFHTIPLLCNVCYRQSFVWISSIFTRNPNTHSFIKKFVFCEKSMINYASGIFIIKLQRVASLFYPAPSLNIDHVVCTVTSHLFHKLAIWQVK